MKKKLLVGIVCIVMIFSYLTACGKNEHLSFFVTESFTAESFMEAVQKYGADHYKGKMLTVEQAEASYKNPTVKPLLSALYYDECYNKNLYIHTLWKHFISDIFGKDNVFTFETFISELENNCITKMDNANSEYMFIDFSEYYIAQNQSIKNICYIDGEKVFNTLRVKPFAIRDIISLFSITETWNRNSRIAYRENNAWYPLVFAKDYWFNDGAYFAWGDDFKDSHLYPRIVQCVKEQLKDPASYRADGDIEIYLVKSPNTSDGYYNAPIYIKVPVRAKNGFGGYNNDTYWLYYDTGDNDAIWYSDIAPTNIKERPYKTFKVAKDLD